MTTVLTVIVPTRGRPDNLMELWAAFVETCTGDTKLVACVDEDDPELDGYEHVHDAIHPRMRDPQFECRYGPRLRLGGTLNAVAPVFAQESKYLAFMGDDHRPRTVGWDTAYMTALDALGTGLVYGDDLIQRAALPTQVAMTSDIVLATGHMVPPGARHLWLDNAWLALGRALGAITYLPDVVVEHVHPIAGNAQWDAGYVECNTDELSSADRAVFEAWQANDLPRWVQQIKEYGRG